MNFTSCINIYAHGCLKPLSNQLKTISDNSRRAEVCLHVVMQQNVAAQNEHFVFAFVNVNIVSGKDVLMFDFAS